MHKMSLLYLSGGHNERVDFITLLHGHSRNGVADSLL
jgi:hypothetical protein